MTLNRQLRLQQLILQTQQILTMEMIVTKTVGMNKMIRMTEGDKGEVMMMIMMTPKMICNKVTIQLLKMWLMLISPPELQVRH